MDIEPTIQQLFNLKGKTAIVTGGTGRLGTSIASALIESGANVVVTSRDISRSIDIASKLSKGEATAFGVQLDQLVPASIDSAFAAALDRFQAVDILVNNAHEHIGTDLTNCTPDEFSRQMHNATGYFLLARKLRDHAVERNSSASIVMIGSMYGLVGSYPDTYREICVASPVAYHALKGGVLQMTRHLAVYWARDGVRVNALSPGPFPGPSVSEEFETRLRSKSPMDRMGLPHELKGAIVFLASDASSYVTGHNLVVDGGWTAW